MGHRPSGRERRGDRYRRHAADRAAARRLRRSAPGGDRPVPPRELPGDRAGQPAQAAAACQRAQELFAAGGHADLALLALNELGWIRYCAGDLPGHRALALDVCEKAEKRGDQMALIQSLGALGCIAAIQGRFGEADRYLRRSTELARAADKRYRYVWNLTMSALALALAGRLAASRTTFERAMHDPEAGDAVTAEWFAQCDWLSGRLDDVVRRVSQSAARRPLAGSRRRAWAAAFAARAAAERGQPDAAARLLALASATYDDRPDDVPGWSNWLPWAAGSMAALAGDPAAGHDLLDQAAGRLRAMGAAVFEAVVLVDATEAAVTAGRAEPPPPTRERLAELSRTIEGEMVGPLAQLAQAYALSPQGARPVPPLPPPRPRMPWTGSAAGSSARWPPRSPELRSDVPRRRYRDARPGGGCVRRVRRGRPPGSGSQAAGQSRLPRAAGRDGGPRTGLADAKGTGGRPARGAWPHRGGDRPPAVHRHPDGRNAPGSYLRQARLPQQARACALHRGTRPHAGNSVAQSVPATDAAGQNGGDPSRTRRRGGPQ